MECGLQALIQCLSNRPPAAPLQIGACPIRSSHAPCNVRSACAPSDQRARPIAGSCLRSARSIAHLQRGDPEPAVGFAEPNTHPPAAAGGRRHGQFRDCFLAGGDASTASLSIPSCADITCRRASNRLHHRSRYDPRLVVPMRARPSQKTVVSAPWQARGSGTGRRSSQARRMQRNALAFAWCVIQHRLCMAVRPALCVRRRSHALVLRACVCR